VPGRARFGLALARLAGSLVAGCLVAGALALPSHANTSHAGWPKIDGRLLIDKGRAGHHRVLRGLRHRHNELLGGYGNDTIYGGDAGDVLWADYRPSGQPASQLTYIYAGNGKNFIYASHGRNIIFTGSGPSVVHAHFGRGEIHCGSASVVVFLSHKDRAGYRLSGCRHISY
jgi:hypothetical protein